MSFIFQSDVKGHANRCFGDYLNFRGINYIISNIILLYLLHTRTLVIIFFLLNMFFIFINISTFHFNLSKKFLQFLVRIKF